MTNWYTVDTTDEQDRLVAAWSDAPIENLELCELILTTAREQVTAFAPKLTPEVTVVDGYVTETIVIPDPWVLAQLKQAKNLYDDGRVASDGDIGGEGYTFTPRPLDKTIRDIIRHKDVRPDVY